MVLFGLTGGIASGKSAVAARLREVGVPVIDADQLSREAVERGSDGLAAVVAAFGDDVLAPDGSLDRKALAARVFVDDTKRKTLNGIVHPIVGRLTMERADALRAKGEALACYEAALIVENGMADAFRPLVVVAASEDVQVARAQARDAASADEVRVRVRAQLPLEQKRAVADYVIENDGSLDDLRKKTDAVLAQIRLVISSGGR